MPAHDDGVLGVLLSQVGERVQHLPADRVHAAVEAVVNGAVFAVGVVGVVLPRLAIIQPILGRRRASEDDEDLAVEQADEPVGVRLGIKERGLVFESLRWAHVRARGVCLLLACRCDREVERCVGELQVKWRWRDRD